MTEEPKRRLQVTDTMNPYAGTAVRVLQDDLYKQVVLARDALESGLDREAYYFVRCAYDIVATLRPGYIDGS